LDWVATQLSQFQGLDPALQLGADTVTARDQVQLLGVNLNVVSESRVMWATSVPILVFLSLSVLDLGPMYATDRRQTASSLNAPA